MAFAQRYGYGSAGFFEVVQGLHPRGIPKSEARGGASVAVKNVKKYLARMDRAVDYDFYDDDDLRYVRFKSPFNRRPLIGRRPSLGKNAGKRTLRLVGSSSPTTCGNVKRLHLVISMTAMTGRTRCRSA